MQGLKIISILILILLLGCETEDNDDQIGNLKSDIRTMAYFSTDRTLNFVQMIDDFFFEIFLNQPEESTFEFLKTNWSHARIEWSQGEIFKYISDNSEYRNIYNRLNSRMISTEHLENGSNTGILQNSDFELTKENLIALNFQNTCLGFHAVEYLLWGSEEDGNWDENGTRTSNEFFEGQYKERKIEFFEIVLDIMIEDLKNLRSSFIKQTGQNINLSLEQKIVSELEKYSNLEELDNLLVDIMNNFLSKDIIENRLEQIYNTKDITLEESPFSDNTLQDLRYNILAIENLIKGRYNTATGIQSNYASLESRFGDRGDIIEKIDEAKITLSSIFEPFDSRIMLGDQNTELENLIEKLKELNQLIK